MDPHLLVAVAGSVSTLKLAFLFSLPFLLYYYVGGWCLIKLTDDLKDCDP